MEPILRGQVKFPEDGRIIWEGRWGMTSAAFEEQNLELLNNFRYTCANHVPLAVGDTVSFKGYFEVTSINKGSKSQFTDKLLEIEVVSEDLESGIRTIKGKGSNRFGNFEISGTFDPSTSVLEVRRMYGARPGPVQKMTTRKASEEENPASASLSDKEHSSSQPQSPSSPAEVQATPSKTLGTSIVSVESQEPEDPQPQIPLDASFYTEARAILKELKARDSNKWFSCPVDVEALGLRDYHNVVKNPMDLGTIQNKMNSKMYTTWDECLSDMRLTFVNALLYNPRGSLVYKAATELSAFLDERIKRVGQVSESSLAAMIGKRAHKKKKFFEPGDLQPTAANVASGTKKTPKASKVANNMMTASTQPSKKSKKITISISKRAKLSTAFPADNDSVSIAVSEPHLPQRDVRVDDDEDVDSFDELEDEVYMTPPANFDDGAVDDTPFSAIHLIDDYNTFGAMSPTNLGDADDF